MVKLTRIYTRGGDAGQTSLGDGSRLPKHDLRIAAYGTVDETNAVIGLVRQHTEGTADAIARSLDMPLEERRERWKSMMKVLRSNDVFTWCDVFLGDLSTDATAASAGKTIRVAGRESFR